LQIAHLGRSEQQRNEEDTFFKDTSIPNKENQRLLRNLNVADYVIGLIKYRPIFAVHSPSEEHADLVRSAYSFLIKFCKGNPLNQIRLHDEIDVFLADLDRCPLSAFLVFEVFKNNKRFLTQYAAKPIKHLAKAAEGMAMGDVRKASFVKILKVFLKYKKKVIKQNQNDILIMMTKSDGKESARRLLKPENQPEIRHLIQDMVTQRQSSALDSVIDYSLPVPLYNLIAQLDLFAACTVGRNETTELKCRQTVMDFPASLDLLRMADFCWPLREAVVNYCLHVFMIAQRQELDVTDSKCAVDMVEVLLNDIDYAVFSREADNQNHRFKFPNGTLNAFRDQAEKYVYTSVMPCFYSFLKQPKNPEKDEQYQRIARTSSALYYATGNGKYKEYAMKVCKYMFEQAHYAGYLAEIQHPVAQLDRRVNNDTFGLRIFKMTKSEMERDERGGDNEENPATSKAYRLQ